MPPKISLSRDQESARDSSGSSSGIYGSLYPSAKAVRDFEYRPRNDLGARTPQPPNNYEIKIKFQTEPTTPLDSYSSFADSTDESAPPQRRFRRLFQKSHNTESSSPPDSEPKFDPMPKPKIKSEHKPRKPDFEPEPYDAEPRLDDIDEVEYKKPERRYDDPVVKVKREVKEVISISSKDQPPVVATVQKSKAVIQENKMFRRQDQRIDLPERDQDPPSNLHRPNSPDWKKPQTLEGIRAYRDPYTSLQPAPPPPQYYKPTREPQYITPTPQALGSIPPSFASNSSGRMNTELAELLQTLPSEVDDVDLTVEIPEQLTVTLMKHQLHGLAWMLDREDKAMGGILADDMGLGKTIQMMSLILARRAPARESRTTLVVAPLALIRQWESEILTKTEPKSLSVYVHHGPNRTKDPKKLQRFDVVITTYQVVASEWPKQVRKKKDDGKANDDNSKGKDKGKSDSDDDDFTSDGDSGDKLPKAKAAKGTLFQATYYRVVLDEAQTIKNRSTRGAVACSNLKSKKRWCLTGTPIQNNVDELYSLFKFLNLQMYSNYPTFKDHFTRPLQQGRSQQARALQRLQVILKAVMLRRTKTTLIDGKPLLDLPARNVIVVNPNFTPEELLFYKALEERTKTTFSKLATSESNRNYMSMLLLLLRLRQACNHPVLVQRSFTDDVDAVEVPVQNPANEEEQDVSDVRKMMNSMGLADPSKGGKERICGLCLEKLQPDDGKYCYACQTEFNLTSSSQDSDANESPLYHEFATSTKIEKMIEILEETKQQNRGEKTIIFSQFTSMLDLVEGPLKLAGYNFVRYDGKMVNKLREASLDKLRNDPSVTVLLISLKCGSLGLNLTCANHVLLLDVWWNPAVEDQAIDRVHRIGQTKDVHVRKLTIPETVEDRIITLQDKKRELAKGALGEVNGLKMNKLTFQDFMYLFDSN